ncbi:DUF4178 domain-containing protein [Jannaschia pohangensis]|uniref:DUF4178 domain-containing protein n=1 Tax=Jannaschia pohangensis TaxID=390807 RepID=A0A1I3RXJ7_9RHOB|nr:DUF4178 domain-containing protein [Jannaschia pohangensis]SFJ51135.1 protein of unknown function [Jannaschia pohangensis]
MTQRSCPNCGAALPEMLAHARMINCEFCGSSVVLDDDVLRKAGEAGEMLDAPELVTIGRAVRLPQGQFTAWGHVRYDYGLGHWDEYYGELNGDWCWLSVDEGDIALQFKVEGKGLVATDFRPLAQVEIGGTKYTCTETDHATAIAFRGQLPEPVAIGDTHRYANFQGVGARIASAEMWDGGHALFVGEWIDPFDLRPA